MYYTIEKKKIKKRHFIGEKNLVVQKIKKTGKNQQVTYLPLEPPPPPPSHPPLPLWHWCQIS
jgi:hypothetical protein